MNCKQGDIAVIVRSAGSNVGKIVRCVSLIPMHTFYLPDGSLVHGPSWVVEPPVRGWNGDSIPGVRDALLRPIRDSDGEDEMLRLAGLPVDVMQKLLAGVSIV